MIAFGEYLPDQRGDVTVVSRGKNVYPDAAGMYGPVPSFVATAATTTNRVQGTIFAIDKDYNVSAYAGTSDKLLKLSSLTSWTDVSKAGGYTTASTDAWEFTQFGNRVVATNFAQAPQTVELTTGGNFADLSANAPKARHVATVNRFVMLGNTFDVSSGNKPSRVWWSAIDDATSWPTPATSAAAAVQSGYQDIFGNGGAVQAIAPRVGAIDAVILQERALIRCQYVGLPDVFSFQSLEGARGCPAPNSVTVIGGICHYLGEDGFYACDGSSSTPIGAGKVDKFFAGDVNQNFLNRVVGVYNAEMQCWLVGYPSAASSTGNIDRILPYNVMTRRWGPAWQVSLTHIGALATVGFTLEQLDSFGTVDSITASFDSRQWAGSGKPVIIGFNASNALGYFSGSNLEAEIETSDTDNDDARLMTTGIRPYVLGVGLATITCKVGYRNSKDATVSYTNPAPLNRALISPVRQNARFTRAVVTIAAGSTWQQLQGFDFNQMAAGTM